MDLTNNNKKKKRKDETIELHPAFHWFGDFANRIELLNGSFYFSTVVHKKSAGYYNHLMSRSEDNTEYCCSQCHFKGTYSDKKSSNMIAHIYLLQFS